MVRRAAALALACALGTAGCLRARGTPEEPVVVGFRLEGVHSVDEDDLEEKLATRESGRWAWSEPSRLDPPHDVEMAAGVRQVLRAGPAEVSWEASAAFRWARDFIRDEPNFRLALGLALPFGR